jgi:hypothetical protein
MDNYKRLQRRLLKINLGFAWLTFFIPIILWMIEGHIRQSISNYAYAEKPYVLPVLLTIASMAYIYDGIAHRFKWWQFIIGGSIIGVALTPHLDYPILHYILTAVFFFGNSAVMVIFSSVHQRWYKILFASVMSLGIILSFIFKMFPVFYGEWIGFIPMIIHYTGEAINKID